MYKYIEKKKFDYIDGVAKDAPLCVGFFTMKFKLKRVMMWNML